MHADPESLSGGGEIIVFAWKGGGSPGWGGGGPRSIFFSVNLICEFKKNELIEFSRWEGGGSGSLCMTDLFSIVRKIYSVYRRLIYESSTCDSGISIQNQLTNILIYIW